MGAKQQAVKQQMRAIYSHHRVSDEVNAYVYMRLSSRIKRFADMVSAKGVKLHKSHHKMPTCTQEGIQHPAAGTGGTAADLIMEARLHGFPCLQHRHHLRWE